jgi:hypothetical protein
LTSLPAGCGEKARIVNRTLASFHDFHTQKMKRKNGALKRETRRLQNTTFSIVNSHSPERGTPLPPNVNKLRKQDRHCEGGYRLRRS